MDGKRNRQPRKKQSSTSAEPEQDAKFFLDQQANSNGHENTTVAAIAFIQDGRDSPDVLHTLLHPVVCPDAATHQCYRQGYFMDYTFWFGENFPIRRTDHTWCRRL